MGKFFKNLGFLILVAIISWGIFLLVTPNKEMKQDVLEYSLNLLGDKLLAMVPDKADQAKVKARYDHFVSKAVRRELSPSQVKAVAANIINVSNKEKHLSGEEAFEVLSAAEEVPQTSEDVIPEVAPVEDQKSLPERIFKWKRPPRPPEADWEDLGEKLGSLYESNENIQKIIRENLINNRQLQQQLRYHVEAGLRVAMDEQLREKLHQKEFRRLSREVNRLENSEMLVWRENLNQEMAQLHENLEGLKELRHLKELEGLKALGMIPPLAALGALEGLKALNSLSVLDSLKTLEGLEELENIPDADSIMDLVEKSLDEAELDSENEEPDPED